MRNPKDRRGSLLVVTLVVLVVVASVTATMVGAIVRSHRQATMALQDAQASRLADAGLRRAAISLRRAADYSGETWTIPAADLGGRDGGEVVITVVDAQEIRAVATFPAYASKPARATRSRRIPTASLSQGDAR